MVTFLVENNDIFLLNNNYIFCRKLLKEGLTFGLKSL